MNHNDRTLWMGDLEAYMDATFIGDAFQRMGEEVHNVKVVHDKYTGRAAGYCFVELSDGDSARRAMLNVNGKVIPASKPPVTFNLSFANSPSAPYTEYNLFVNNIPVDLDDAGLFLVFGERYRSCRGAKVYRNSDGSSKGLGFIRFADQTDQQKALVEMNKMMVHGKEIILKLAQPKFRAPRGAHGVPNYDPTNYYPRYQDFYNTQPQQFQIYDCTQPQQVYIQQQAPMMMPTTVLLQPAGAYMTTTPMMTMPMQQPQMMITTPPQLHPQQQQSAFIEDERYAMQSTSGREQAASGGGGGKNEFEVAAAELESYDDPYRSVEEANYVYMERSNDLYGAMEQSRWFPRLQTAAVGETDFS